MKIELSFDYLALPVPREITLKLPVRMILPSVPTDWSKAPTNHGFTPPQPAAAVNPASTMYMVPINALSIEQLTSVCNRFQRDLFEAAGHPVECIHPVNVHDIGMSEDGTPFADTIAAWFETLAPRNEGHYLKADNRGNRFYYANAHVDSQFSTFFDAVRATLKVANLSYVEFVDLLHDEVTPE